MSTGRKVWLIVLPLLLYLIITMAVSVILEIIVMYIVGFHMPDADSFGSRLPSALLCITLASYIAVLIVMVLMYRKDRMMTGEAEQKLKASGIVLSLVICILVSFGVQYLISISGIDRIFTEYDALYNRLFADQPVILLAVTVGIVGPVAEELLCRGLLFRRLERFTNTPVAVIVSALIFGFIHMNMVQFIYASVMGLLFAVFYARYRNIWIPILAHMAVNMTGVIAAAVS